MRCSKMLPFAGFGGGTRCEEKYEPFLIPLPIWPLQNQEIRLNPGPTGHTSIVKRSNKKSN